MPSESPATLLIELYGAVLAFPVVVGAFLFACLTDPKDVRSGKGQPNGLVKVAHQYCFDADSQDLPLRREDERYPAERHLRLQQQKVTRVV